MNELPTYQPDFEEYIRQGEPGKQERAQIWRTAIGLQQVDGLETSDYLKQTVRRNIEGEITIDEVQRLVKEYYVNKTNREPDDDDKQEADLVTGNIGKILSSKTLDFTVNGYLSLHRRIFAGVFKHAGQIRDYDITKSEFVLRGGTVNYLNFEDIRLALDYEISREKTFDYSGLSSDEIIEHIAQFVSDVWQIHAFREGNTRTTAVFAIQYLRSIGYKVNNDMFAAHSWYFRNALVRANYKNVVQGINYEPVYLERFFRNLLLGEQWDLKSRYLVINPPAEYAVQPPADVGNVTENGIEIQKSGLNTKRWPEKWPKKWPEKAQRIIDAIASNPKISIQQLEFKLDIGHTTIKKILKAMQDESLLRRVGPDKGGHWEINE